MKLMCGAAERVVTPPLGLNIPQFMIFNPAKGVKDDLFTHAIALEQGGKAVILTSIDTSGLGASFTRRVRAELQRQIGEMMKILKSRPNTFASFEKVNEIFGNFKRKV